MADEQPTTAPASEDQPTNAPEATSEAATNNDASEAAAPSTEAPATDGEEPKITSEEVEAAGPQATTEINPPDGEGKAEADPAAAADDVAAATDSAPAADAAAGKGKRKSVGAVPEHKTKKLQKKKSMVNLNLGVQPGEHYWARLKGYPPWPSVCCDEEMLPESLLATRPVSTMRPDGTYREDYEEGGKNAKERTYPMMFLATNEFAWMINTSLTRLEPTDCDARKNDKKLSKDLKRAYEVAAETHDLNYYKEMLQQHEEELKEFAAEQERYEAEQAAKEQEKAEKAAQKAEKDTKKKVRKSKGGEGDEMDVDDNGEQKPASKKRKKEADSEGDDSKPAKKPTKVKLNAKENGTTPAKKPKAKKVVVKPEDSNGDAPASEEARFEQRKVKVLHHRHRLQKGFISREGSIKEDEMPQMADHLSSLENLENLEAAIIRETKIHKVLKAILKLDTDIPRDSEFNFKSRCNTLLDTYNSILEGSTESKTPTTNGNSVEKSGEPNGEETTEDLKAAAKTEASEPPSAPIEATEPGNGAVDEADVDMADASVGAEKEDKPAEAAADVVKDGAEEAKKEAAEDTTAAA